LVLLIDLARSFTAPLSSNAANNSLKELLKTAEVQQRRNRVLVTARLSPAFFSGLAAEETAQPATQADPATSK
jgi:hypothetical protein